MANTCAICGKQATKYTGVYPFPASLEALGYINKQWWAHTRCVSAKQEAIRKEAERRGLPSAAVVTERRL